MADEKATLAENELNESQLDEISGGQSLPTSGEGRSGLENLSTRGKTLLNIYNSLDKEQGAKILWDRAKNIF